jgi:transcriptional regulator with XRE-family HTH domain
MNQPELGKKIAELRKAKGLTQEELVSKCKLTVRTLQRIESGVVTPRSYTIKMLFAALDYNVYNFSESDSKKEYLLFFNTRLSNFINV